MWSVVGCGHNGEEFSFTRRVRDARPEIKPPLSSDEAHAEANRCLFCYDAPCTQACPTHIDVPLFIQQIATGNTAGSARTIFAQNVLGHSCARVCPTEVLCEGACVLNDQHRPINIGSLQRFATDHALSRGLPIVRAAAKEDAATVNHWRRTGGTGLRRRAPAAGLWLGDL